MIYILIIVAICLFVFYMIWKKTKHLKLDNVTMVTGGVKTGKTTLAVYLAVKQYKKVHRVWKIKTFFQKLLHRNISEEPLFYSNIPLNMPFVPITEDLLTRKARFRYKSVILVSECSLVLDSMSYKNDELNERSSLFNKLIGHETQGGYLFYETQAIQDNHYSIKRCLNNYIWINKLLKFCPFFLLYQVRELKYNGDDSTLNIFNEDNEEATKLLLVPKKVWKYFDCYCYSYLTDNLKVVDNVIQVDNLKANDIVSFINYKTIKKGDLKNEENKKDI